MYLFLRFWDFWNGSNAIPVQRGLVSPKLSYHGRLQSGRSDWSRDTRDPKQIWRALKNEKKNRDLYTHADLLGASCRACMSALPWSMIIPQKCKLGCIFAKFLFFILSKKIICICINGPGCHCHCCQFSLLFGKTHVYMSVTAIYILFTFLQLFKQFFMIPVFTSLLSTVSSFSSHLGVVQFLLFTELAQTKVCHKHS